MNHHVYRCWAGEELVYVGVTDNVPRRISAHSEHSEWFPFVSRVTHESYGLRMLAEQAESVAIRTENPLFNIRGIDGRTARKMELFCAYCTLENTVTIHSAHWDLKTNSSTIIRAYRSGQIHGHDFPGGTKVSIESVIAWQRGETLAVAA